jgi:hypothetical protein
MRVAPRLRSRLTPVCCPESTPVLNLDLVPAAVRWVYVAGVGAGLAPRIRNVGSVGSLARRLRQSRVRYMMLGPRSASPDGPIGYAGC